MNFEDFGGIANIGFVEIDTLVECPRVVVAVAEPNNNAPYDFDAPKFALDAIGENVVVGKYPKLPA